MRGKLNLVPAKLKDYPIMQNMARFYAYDMSRDCGRELEGWEFPENGLYECSDFKKYLEGKGKHAFIIKVDNELAGFVFVNKLEVMPEVDYNMGEFFIVAKFQRSGIGRIVAKEMFNRFSGEWSVGAIPQNTRALNFWRKVISEYTNGNFLEVEKTGEELRTSEYPDPYPMKIFIFNTMSHIKIREADKHEYSEITDISIKTWKESYQDIIDANFLDNISSEERLKGRIQWLSEPEKYSIVAVSNSKIVGFCDFGISRYFQYGKGEIYAIYVLPEYQKKGIGYLLIQEAVNRLKDKNLVPCVIFSLEKNLVAQKLYTKMGFFAIDTVMKKIGDKNYPEIVFNNNHEIRNAQINDISSMVSMSYQKRRSYEKEQPQFWRHSGPNAEISQAKWFEELLNNKNYILLTAKQDAKITGFIIRQLILSPEVYNPGGLTLMIDDFCVDNEIDWQFSGKKLIDEIKKQAKEKGAVQVIVVCGEHDKSKSHFLKEVGLTVASNWNYGEIT